MRGPTRVGQLLILILLVAMLGLPGLAMADDVGADVFKEFECWIFLSPIGRSSYVVSYDTHQVVTPSGNTIMKCTADIPAGYAPSKLVVSNGGLCRTHRGATTTSMRKVFTPSGKAHLTCQIKGNG